MARSIDIVDFSSADNLDETARRKLNLNFSRLVSYITAEHPATQEAGQAIKIQNEVDAQFAQKYTELREQLLREIKTEVDKEITSQKRTLVNDAHPVGSIYLSATQTNPATLFPGTQWTQIKDYFIVASGDTSAPGATGTVSVANTDPTTTKSYRTFMCWQRVS